MIAIDVNVLVSATVSAAADHDAMRAWLEQTVAGAEPVVLTPAVLTGALRVMTHPRVFTPPIPLEQALASLSVLLDHPHVRVLAPGSRSWPLLVELCRVGAATGNLVADAGHAATAIEHGLTWVSKDRDFGRFPGLRWRLPQ